MYSVKINDGDEVTLSLTEDGYICLRLVTVVFLFANLRDFYRQVKMTDMMYEKLRPVLEDKILAVDHPVKINLKATPTTSPKAAPSTASYNAGF